jgi:hypothetical protein
VGTAREQGRTIEIQLGGQRKELEIGVGSAPPPASRAHGGR